MSTEIKLKMQSGKIVYFPVENIECLDKGWTNWVDLEDNLHSIRLEENAKLHPVGWYYSAEDKNCCEIATDFISVEDFSAAIKPDPDPDPEPPAPAPAPAPATLPTAQIGEVAAPKKLDVADTSFDIDGTHYNVEFFEEHEGFMAYVVMYVNGKLFKVQTLQKRANTGYRYFSRSTFKNGTEVEEMAYNTRPHVSIFLDKQASLMLYVFKNTLKYQATQASKTATPVTPATVAEKAIAIGTIDYKTVLPLLKITYKDEPIKKALPAPEPQIALPMVGDKVIYKGKSCPIIHVIPNGNGGRVFLGIRFEYDVKKKNKDGKWVDVTENTIITRPYAEFEIVHLEAVA